MLRFVLPLVVLLPQMASAHDYKVGDLVIAHPIAGETAAGAMTGAGYMTITNNGADDMLMAVTADFPRVMLHQSVQNGDMASMEHVTGLAIPAGQTVELAPGGYHIMFMGLEGDPLEVGEVIPATLMFENAGVIDVDFKVEKILEDHSGH